MQENQRNLFLSRDSSWLRFNRRVLEEAQNPDNPLLERVKFLAITASNLDEFIEVRIAGMLQRIEEGMGEPGADGMTPDALLAQITGEMHAFVADQYACWNTQLHPALSAEGVRVLRWSELGETARKAASGFYQREVDPLLTPITIDPRHPFPRVLNKALSIALLLRSKRRGSGMGSTGTGAVLGVVTVPRALSRFVALPHDADTGGDDNMQNFLFLHDLIEHQATGMYRGYEVLSTAPFRVTRNSNLYFEEEEARSLLEAVRSELHNRRKGDAVRLEIEHDAHPEIVERLRSNFELDDTQVFRADGPVNLSRLMNLYGLVDRPDLKFQPFAPRELRLHRKSVDLFDELRNHDVLLHHPYDSYDGVVGFIEAGASDPSVVSMKQTLYRTSDDSPIFRALTEAAQTKEVTVVVELTARFDEASNIRWARNLEDAGVQVFHGIVGLKTHCKLALLVRREEDGTIRRYAHLGTGNYNPVTSKFYTDLSLLTADPEITAGVHAVFNYLTAHSESADYKPLLVAPLTLAENTIRLIQRETEHARAGHPARIVAKMNSLLEPSIIEALYAASQAGVEIDLIVRGICSLRPGLPGVSERIRVRSIVGRFLEHSRIFYFANSGDEEIYGGSADWMPRNLFERCEVAFPIKDPALKTRIKAEILDAYLADTAKTRMLGPDGIYTPAGEVKRRTEQPFNAQDFLVAVAEGRQSAEAIPLDRFSLFAPTGGDAEKTLTLEKSTATTEAPLVAARKPRKRKPLRGDG
jgi:polyphosphate kinase